MEDRETARMRKYGESKTTRIIMATVPHETSGLGLGKFQADGFLLTRVYNLIQLINMFYSIVRIPTYNRSTGHSVKLFMPKQNVTIQMHCKCNIHVPLLIVRFRV